MTMLTCFTETLMKNNLMMKLLLLLSLVLSPALLGAQNSTGTTQVTVQITGEVTNPYTLTMADFKQMPKTQVTRKDKDNKEHVYYGVLLSSILQKAGVTSGKDLRGKNLTKYVLISAGDGYQVIFALAELDKDFTDRTIILADQVDGAPLSPAEGPFRVIVQDEKKPARCIRQVTAIKVMFAK